MKGYIRPYVLSLILCTLSSPANAQEDESIQGSVLDSVTVKAYRYRSPLKQMRGGTILWDMSSISLLPQTFGNADPVHYAQMLPGIQTNGEYRSGINIEGCDNGHNAIFIEGVPIYNVNHLLGFFSIFNAPHFPSMSLAKGVVSAASPNRLGGQLEMSHDKEIPDTASGIISLGLVSSQGTLRLPINRKTSITASLRGSYMNLLYSKWLKDDGQQIKYSFYDVNLSVAHRPDSNNTVLMDFYCGGDNAGFSGANFLIDMNARWGNMMGDFSSKTTSYISYYRDRFKIEMQDLFFRLPSSIMDCGVKNGMTWKRWSIGIETVLHNIHPQSIEHKTGFNITDGHAKPMRSFEGSLYANYEYPITECVWVSGGLRGSLFKQGSNTRGAVDPSLRFLYDNHTVQFSASYAMRHQYLFQTGFSDFGLPTEFWISAGDGLSPQYAHEVSASGSSYLFNRRFRVSLDLSYRRLYHQLGYKGSVLDYVNTVYDINSFLLHGKGENYGFSVMVNKCTGRLTGWLSYTYTHARRYFDGGKRRASYPASHERPHELNVVATYRLGRHWDFGGTFVYASGTPFTAAKALYLLNNNILIKYGEYNAARLHPYMRFDVSVSYKWGKRGEHGVNLSVYNATSRDNELFYYLKTHDDGSYVYRPVTFVFHTLPSVSYSYKF